MYHHASNYRCIITPLTFSMIRVIPVHIGNFVDLINIVAHNIVLSTDIALVALTQTLNTPHSPILDMR